MVGGSVKVGQMLGQYPSNFSSGPLHLGNGILLPTTPWEALWNGLGQWFGVEEKSLNSVLPNRPNFLNGQATEHVQLSSATTFISSNKRYLV